MIVFEKEGVQHHVEFPNRCFFCFVKVTSDFHVVSFDTSAQVPFPVQWFQQVFNHLVPYPDKNSIEFGRSPPICADCGTLLEVLHAALTQLASVTIGVKSRISNLGTDAINKEQRLHNFFGDWRNISRGSGSHQEALNVLKKIGHGPFPRWMNWFQEYTFSGNCTDTRQDGEVLEFNQDEFQGEAKPGGSHEEIPEIEKLDKEEPGFVEDLEKKEPGFEIEMQFDFGNEDEEFFDEEECMDMEEEPSQASRLESHEQDPLTDTRSLQKVFVSEEKLVGGSMTVKSLLLQGISKPQESTRLCDFCREPVIVRQLLNHVRGHVGDYAKACPNPTCTHVFALLTSLRSHAKNSKNCRGFCKEDITTCEICGHPSKTMKSLLTHLKATHDEAVKPYLCPVSACCQTFPVRQAVNYHLASNVVLKEQTISPASSQPCPDCGKEYHPEKIPNHLVEVHGTCPDTVVTCKYCPFSFPTRDKLIQHCAVHFQHGMKISCDLCQDERIFNSHIQFRKHFFLVHKVGTVEFICEFCNKGYFEKKYYQSHVASHHHGEAASTSNQAVGKDQDVILSHSANQSCDFCCQSVNFGRILEHVRGHVGDFALACPNPACRHVYSNLKQ